MTRTKRLIGVLILILTTAIAGARAPKFTKKGNGGTPDGARAANCAPATAKTYLELNNVRALIETGGKMWQDRSTGNPSYEVPKGSGKHAIYAGALWMGGVDYNGQLKLAAQLFGQGNDFWSGPLQTNGSAEVTAETCDEYDRFFPVSRSMVEEFNAWFACKSDPNCEEQENFPGYSVPQEILNWPAHGGPGEDFYLAPFYDMNDDGIYDPSQGDYPGYDINNEIECHNRDRNDPVPLFGDKTYWWVFNDNGNVHTETGGTPIGMEIRAQAFSFATNDEVNNMTFYNYELINQGSTTLYDTYFGQYCDADIGNPIDDYVGCDVTRGLGYTYNGYALDETIDGYGANPPAIGIDFFEGPYMDYDGIDNPGPTADNNYFVSYQDAAALDGITYKGIGIGYGDGVPDNERLGMRSFFFFDNAGTNPNNAMTDPDDAQDYYNYMRGFWKNGQTMCYGGNGFSNAGACTQTTYMYPGDSDPQGWATNGVVQPEWTEQSANNFPGDRRMLQSAGPFTLEPGARNNITVGVVYARAATGDPMASVELLKVADDKAQSLFDNCFQLLTGPHAPELTIQEMDKELIVTLDNHPSSNNANEDYEGVDPFIPETHIDQNGDLVPSDRKYRFQGYQVYQLRDKDVSISEIHDIEKARLVFQCDKKDSVSQLINYVFDESIGASVPYEMVDGTNEGIRHSFKVTKDLFADGDSRLVNHKAYYYIAVAYAHNEFKNYDPTSPLYLDGQKKPYVESRMTRSGGEVAAYTAIPHIPAPEQMGTEAQAEYGDEPEITRLDGRGNGHLSLRLTPETEEVIIQNNFAERLTYRAGQGPVTVKVVDPLNVPADKFHLVFLEDSTGNLTTDSPWVLINLTTGDSITSKMSISADNEQIIPEYGISITIDQVEYEVNNGIHYTAPIGSELIYADPTDRWLTGVEDAEGFTPQNWIRVGTVNEQNDPDAAIWNDIPELDNDETYEDLINGTWAPFKVTASGQEHAPVQYSNYQNFVKLTGLPSVEIVFTKDKSKWTRVPVLEMQYDSDLSQGNADWMSLRNAPSVDKNGDADNSGNGYGWFPGYAIDLETGDRLNMAFGEDSWMAVDNGRDMVFNPTSKLYTSLGEPVFGGKHYVYVFKNQARDKTPNYLGAYDGGNNIKSMIDNGSWNQLWRSCAWVGMPMVEEGHELISNETRVRLLVEKEYEEMVATDMNLGFPMYEFDMTEFSTIVNDIPTAEEALSLVNVVPNPYYGFSAYEVNRVDNRVKITNLPETCTIRIYSVNGTLVRTLTKDSPMTSIDWDLKNHKGIPIAGGVYLIHIHAPEIGERIIKWFGALRPPDLQNL